MATISREKLDVAAGAVLLVRVVAVAAKVPVIVLALAEVAPLPAVVSKVSVQAVVT